MMQFISKDALEELRKRFPVGSRVELTHMNDPYNTTLHEGCRGTVRAIDDIGTIHVSWDCGSSLGVVYGEDSCRKLDSVKVICYNEEKTWDSRTDAEQFYLQAMLSCEGSECNRYTKIYCKIKEGLDVCTDDDD